MGHDWLTREAIVTVKAYPNPSAKYFESVCVAAITREEGWVRLYPVNFRSLPEGQRFKKYQIVRLRMRKHDKDSRPESFRPDESSIELQNIVGAGDKWRSRWDWIRPSIGPSMCELIKQQKSIGKSLACIKPRQILDFEIEDAETSWTGRKQSIVDQIALFDQVETKLERIPHIFRYRYKCEDQGCKGHFQSIIDWELMELYRKVHRETTERSLMVQKIRDKYLGELCGPDKDTHLFVGNHSSYPGSFMVLGVFWPPKDSQKSFL